MKQKIIILLVVLLSAYIGWRVYQYYELKAKLPSRKSLIENNLQERLAMYSDKVKKKCIEGFLEEAQDLADSIVFNKANELMLFDSLSRPTKPDKPLLPPIKPLKDSVNVRPLLQDSVLQDQEF